MSPRNVDSSPPPGESTEAAGPIDDALLGRCLDDKFIIRELIGVGPAGRVYRADQVALDRSVAVKVMGPLRDGKRQLAQRFHDEAFAVSRLQHPNVVSVYDYGRTDDGLLYVVMEYLYGRRLSTLIADEYPIPPERVVTIMVQVLDALEEAHTAGVIHADLKSDNVIVETLRDGRTLAKVVDFGLAQLFHESTTDPMNVTPDTFTKLLDGAPEYLAPEVIAGAKPARQADLYSAGVILYELLTGSLPFSGQAVFADEPPARDGQPLPPTLTTELERVAVHALERAPEDRFPDAGSFRRALQALVDDGPDVLKCSACGYRNEPEFRFCAQCGSRLAAANPAAEATREIEHARRIAQQAFDHGDLSGATEMLRRAVGQAIRIGDVSLIIGAYCSLAGILAQGGSIHDAIGEVEEAIDLVTIGGTSDELDTPDEIWRLRIQLAELYHHDGRSREALAMGSRALHSSRQASSTEGRKAAQALMAQLYAQARKTNPQPVEKLATPEDNTIDAPLFSQGHSLRREFNEDDTAPWQLLDEDDLDD